MSRRSKSLADDLKARQDSENAEKLEKSRVEQVRNQKILRDDKVLEREAPKIWTRFAEEVQKQVNEFNEEPSIATKLAVNRSVLNRVAVSYLDADNVEKELRFSFDQQAYTITPTGLYLSKIAPFKIKILNGASDPIVVDDQDKEVELESAIDVCFRKLLGLRK